MALNTMEFKQQRLVNGQTELELNQVFNFVADGLAIIDIESNVVRINRTYLNMLNLSESDVVNKKCYDVLDCNICNTPNCPLTLIKKGG